MDLAELLPRGGGILAQVVGSSGSVSSYALEAPPNGSFRIASITKAYIASALVCSDIDIDTSAAEVVSPTLWRASQLPSLVTVRDLLGHRSGLGDHAADPRYLAAVLAEPAKTWTRLEQVEWAARLPRRIGFAYSDTGYVLLGDALERRYGLNLGRVLRLLLPFERWPHTYQEVFETPAGDQPQEQGKRLVVGRSPTLIQLATSSAAADWSPHAQTCATSLLGLRTAESELSSPQVRHPTFLGSARSASASFDSPCRAGSVTPASGMWPQALTRHLRQPLRLPCSRDPRPRLLRGILPPHSRDQHNSNRRRTGEGLPTGPLRLRTRASIRERLAEGRGYLPPDAATRAECRIPIKTINAALTRINCCDVLAENGSETPTVIVRRGQASGLLLSGRS